MMKQYFAVVVAFAVALAAQIVPASAQYFSISDEQNLRTCLQGYSYNCDHARLSSQESSRVQQAEYQRNLRTCSQGYSYNCNHSLLRADDAESVAQAEYRRNYQTCLQGYAYNCTHRKLSHTDLERVKAAEYQRNLQTCLQGYRYNCRHGDLQGDDRQRVVEAEYGRNLQTCLQGYSYNCRHGELSSADSPRVTSAERARNDRSSRSKQIWAAKASEVRDVFGTSSASVSAPTNLLSVPQSAPARSASTYSGCAENGSCYGDLSTLTGRPKTVHVGGYFRSDGTYVRGHYRSKPRY